MEVKLQLFPNNSRLVLGISNKFYLSLWESELDLEPVFIISVEESLLRASIKSQEFTYKIPSNNKERKLVLSLKNYQLKVKIDNEKIFSSEEDRIQLSKISLAKLSPNSKVLELSKVKSKDLELAHNSDKKWITLLILISALTVVVMGTTILISVKVSKKKRLESIDL